MGSRDEQVTDHLVHVAGDGTPSLALSVLLKKTPFALLLPKVGELIVGRSTDADIQLVEKGISREHARLRLLGERCTIEDLGSRNGTFVSDERLQAVKALVPGNEVAVGDVRLVLLRRSAIARTTPTLLSRPSLHGELSASAPGGAQDPVGWLVAILFPTIWYQDEDLAAALKLLPSGSMVGVYREQVLLAAGKGASGRPDEASLRPSFGNLGLRVVVGPVPSGVDPRRTAEQLADRLAEEQASGEPLPQGPEGGRSKSDGEDAASGAVRDALKSVEKKRILDALKEARGNQTPAAEILGLPRRTLSYRMARLGISADKKE